MNTEAITLSTPEQIAAYRLLSLRGMLRLEKVGLKSRGGAVRPRIADELGLKPRDSYELYISTIENKLGLSK
jgi:hypothetical protein